ncbi:MOSC domain-containing protein [Tamlana fucoidanivorans]|uniref:MOSC domain-containing protein n=1 Tax=Allotamlana fucoidanivorans TaxID=2583814 RepID=A0A5C4SIT2_9FLAO|nr:MOSC domain-containing protein [Tamlana fucoidanivorans]TNJ43538.1 MOSC domain-containing protein [Tamlana fucoidanivorans]
MKVISTNLANPTSIVWQGQEVTTGIYKKPSLKPILLGKEGVLSDEVSDKKVHGGTFKACYLFSELHYTYWEKQYPDLEWDYGMFGENLTISNLDESKIHVGDIYKLGQAIVEITQPREPCFKLAYKFGTIEIIEQFIHYGYSGTYVRILEEGLVKVGDTLKLVKKAKNSISTKDLFELIFAKNKNQELLQKVIDNEALPLKKRHKLKTFITP